jgi:hypothetical protein
VIALSIAVLAAEVLRAPGSKPSLTERAPWLVAFAFGLLHGLGFASALLEIGLPEGDVPLALLAFNLGVEAGQILFIAVVLALGAAIARIYPERSQADPARIPRPAHRRLRHRHAGGLLGLRADGGVCRMKRTALPEMSFHAWRGMKKPVRRVHAHGKAPYRSLP